MWKKNVLLFLLLNGCIIQDKKDDDFYQEYGDSLFKAPEEEHRFLKKGDDILKFISESKNNLHENITKIQCDQDFFNKSYSFDHIIHTTNEFGVTTVGGLGIVVNNLLQKLDKNYLFDIATPYYTPFESAYPLARKICEIEHIFNFEKITSEIFAAKGASGSEYFNVFFVRPSKGKYENIFSLQKNSAGTTGEHVYTFTKNSSLSERFLYFSSAAGIFFNFLASHPKYRLKIVHLHGYTGVIIPRYLSSMEKKNMKFILTLHSLNFDQGQFYHNVLMKGEANLCKIGINDADFIHMVSNFALKEGLSNNLQKSYGLSKLLQKANFLHKMQAIGNGIDNSEWRPYHNPKKLKTTLDSIEIDFSKHGTDDFDSDESYSEWKQRIKSHLKKLHYIKDENRPLFVFVGRFSREKGIDILDNAAELINSLGGSLIIMGADVGDVKSMEMLRTLSKKTNKLHLYVMKGDYKNEQVKNNIGNLIRAGSDFSFVPSREESFGLVPMEFFNFRSPCVASGVQGMQDYMIQINKENPNGNCFLFNIHKLETTLKHSIEEAISFYKEADSEKDIVRKNLFLKANEYDWSGISETFYSMYDHVASEEDR